MRFALGVIVAPLVPGLLFGLPDVLFAKSSVGVGWYLQMAAVAGYPPLIVVGAPLYWFAFRRRPATFWTCILIGLVLGAVAYLRAFVGGSTDGKFVDWDAMSKTLIFLPVSMFCGTLAVASFWLVARPDKSG
jgi:hypothetical protein